MNDWKSWLLALLTGVLLSSAAGWLVIGKQAISREDAEKLIETTGPYMRDRGQISEKLNSIDQRVGRMESKLDAALARP